METNQTGNKTIEVRFLKIHNQLEEQLGIKEKLTIADKLVYELLLWYCVINKTNYNTFSNDDYSVMLNLNMSQPSRSFKKLEELKIINIKRNGKSREIKLLKKPGKNDGFIPVPISLLKCDFTLAEKMIYCVIRLYSENFGDCRINNNEISERSGVDRRTVIRAIQKLEEDGIIRVENIDKNKRVIHILVDFWKKSTENYSKTGEVELTDEELSNLEFMTRLSEDEAFYNAVHDWLDYNENKYETERGSIL